MPHSDEIGWLRIPLGMRPLNIPKQRFADFPSLQVKEEADGSWLIKTQEDYYGRAKPGIELSLLARGVHFERSGLNRLRNLNPLEGSTPPEQLEAYASLRERLITIRQDEEPLWYRFSGVLQITLDSDVEGKLQELQRLGRSSDSLWLAEASPILSKRLAFMRLLFAKQHTPAAISTTNFVGVPGARALMMNSSSSFTLFFHPFLLLDSPLVGGFTASRPYATIIRMLSETEPGRPKLWTDQLDSFQPSYAGSASWTGLGVRPSEDLATREQLLRWWATSVSKLLWVVTDPTRHSDLDGNYSPSAHLGVTLTVERFFVTAVEILCLKSKNEVLRKILLFDLLDLLEGHKMGDYETNLSYRKQYDEWSRLKGTLPESVANCLSPVIEGAFEALELVGNGFWSEAIRTSDGNLLVPSKNRPGQEVIGIDKAVTQYIKVLRNSHHGFRKIAKDPRDLFYLASHTGELDNRLSDLVWWYLIRMLSNPDRVAPLRLGLRH